MSTTAHIRHGLYLPVDLLDQLRSVATREGRSINKQIEQMLREWLVMKKDHTALSRREMLRLPIERRRELLEAQAEQLAGYYSKQLAEYSGGQGDPLLEYD